MNAKVSVGLWTLLILFQSVTAMADDFYDETVLRTLQLEFSQSDWWNQLEANYESRENILATLVVDDIVCENVGVRFRGNTSYMMTGDSLKKSFNIEIDYMDEDQRLMGFKTLDLLNCASGPSFMREVLYSNTCRQQFPSAKANFVTLEINGENWGVYAIVQPLGEEGGFIGIDSVEQSSEGHPHKRPARFWTLRLYPYPRGLLCCRQGASHRWKQSSDRPSVAALVVRQPAANLDAACESRSQQGP